MIYFQKFINHVINSIKMFQGWSWPCLVPLNLVTQFGSSVLRRSKSNWPWECWICILSKFTLKKMDEIKNLITVLQCFVGLISSDLVNLTIAANTGDTISLSRRCQLKSVELFIKNIFIKMFILVLLLKFTGSEMGNLILISQVVENLYCTMCLQMMQVIL